MSSFITSIGTANPKYKFSQDEVLHFMTKALALSEEETHKLKVLYRASGIKTRYSVIPDYKLNGAYELYKDHHEFQDLPLTGERNNIYQKKALDLSAKAVEQLKFKSQEITHLITVSCTGLYAPGLDIDLIQRLGLRSNIQRTSINFMGCYAAFNAIKIADSICGAKESNKVLVVCTEICSLHFQNQKTDDNFLANALFGDGSAALIIEGKPGLGINLRTSDFYCDLLSNGKPEMAWSVGNHGFEMHLSSYVPEVIRNGIGSFIKNLNGHSDKPYDFFAIHPGGKKILQVLEDELNISSLENHFAHEVLRDFGNMSSPTVLFVLKRLWESLKKEDNEKSILSFAFGPGLTLESMTLKVIFN